MKNQLRTLFLLGTVFSTPLAFAALDIKPSILGNWAGYPEGGDLVLTKDGIEGLPDSPKQKIIEINGNDIINMIHKQQIDVHPETEFFISMDIIKSINPKHSYKAIESFRDTYTDEKIKFVFIHNKLSLFITNGNFVYVLKKVK